MSFQAMVTIFPLKRKARPRCANSAGCNMLVKTRSRLAALIAE